MASHDTDTRKWSAADVPDQSGRVAVVTGANTGIGFHTAAVLAYRGAHMVLAVRNLEKGNAALSRIVAAGGQGARKVDVTLQ
jgi:NAD(P)-dependent dehydrogenase (short-subunit alcohol dehydrogenase family)